MGEEWIEQAEKMVHEEYAANYKKAAASEDMSILTSTVQVCGIISCAFSNSFKLIQGNESVSLFANFAVGTSAVATVSEVDKYLNCPVKSVLDPLK